MCYDPHPQAFNSLLRKEYKEFMIPRRHTLPTDRLLVGWGDHGTGHRPLHLGLKGELDLGHKEGISDKKNSFRIT